MANNVCQCITADHEDEYCGKAATHYAMPDEYEKVMVFLCGECLGAHIPATDADEIPKQESSVCGFCNGKGIPPDGQPGDEEEMVSPNGEECPVCGVMWKKEEDAK